MEISLPEHLTIQIQQQITSGRYCTVDELMAEAVSLLLDQQARSQRRIESLRRIGQMVDDAGLYERVLIPVEN